SLGTPAIWYPMSLRGGGFNVAGNSFAGTPFIIHGQNEKLGWGSTVNPMDVTDWYSEKVVPAPGTASGLGTMYKGKVEEIIAIPQVFRMNAPGTGVKDNIVVVPVVGVGVIAKLLDFGVAKLMDSSAYAPHFDWRARRHAGVHGTGAVVWRAH
ncbi:MAG: penicillin acylase family protein, partial [Deltaproteobacteria bacterium]